MAFGVAGLSCLADSLSAIKHARAVTPVVDEATGLVAQFETEGDWPAFGNDDPRVDDIAAEITRGFTQTARGGRLPRRGAGPC